MYITRYTDYSLRVLIYLAVKGDELSTIADIAHSYQISKNHLMKVVQALSAKGYLQAIRGKNGGIKLKAEPETICIGTLVRDIEGGAGLVECFGETNSCVITSACQLKMMFAEAMESFFAALDQYSLADLIVPNKHQQLTQLLNVHSFEVE